MNEHDRYRHQERLRREQAERDARHERHERRKKLHGDELFHELIDAIEEFSANLGKYGYSITEGLAAVAKAISNNNTPPGPSHVVGRFKLILKNNQPDFGYDFDVSGITDSEGEPITDPAVLAGVVKEVTSDNTSVVSATQPDADGEGSIHIGTSGAATLSGKAWLSQADKDAGKDPAVLASEPFTITTGDPAAITEAHFSFDVDSGGTPSA